MGLRAKCGLRRPLNPLNGLPSFRHLKYRARALPAPIPLFPRPRPRAARWVDCPRSTVSRRQQLAQTIAPAAHLQPHGHLNSRHRASRSLRPISRPCKVSEPGLDYYTDRGAIALRTTLRAVPYEPGAAHPALVGLRVAHAASGNNHVSNAFAHEGMPSVRAPGLCLCLWLALQAASPCRAVWVLCGSAGRRTEPLPVAFVGWTPARRVPRDPVIPSDWHASFLSTRRPCCSRGGRARHSQDSSRDGHGLDGGGFCAFPFVMLSTRRRSRGQTPPTAAAAADNIITPRVVVSVSIINKLRAGVFSTIGLSASVIDLPQMLEPGSGKRVARSAAGIDALLLGVADAAWDVRGPGRRASDRS
ncbi:hypothetical protein AURDEDRAFT_164941 [Auricularia subglabra TFB-10046 SS5]|nr:hypothetical protein AURDEDRAFT_164941 [Auricularia subglabra TFB-10046 SS5]